MDAQRREQEKTTRDAIAEQKERADKPRKDMEVQSWLLSPFLPCLLSPCILACSCYALAAPTLLIAAC